jgi:hypothetical protein
VNGCFEDVEVFDFMQIHQNRSTSLRMTLEFKDLEARALVFWVVGNKDAVQLGPLIASLCGKRFNFLANKFPGDSRGT